MYILRSVVLCVARDTALAYSAIYNWCKRGSVKIFRSFDIQSKEKVHRHTHGVKEKRTAGDFALTFTLACANPRPSCCMPRAANLPSRSRVCARSSMRFGATSFQMDLLLLLLQKRTKRPPPPPRAKKCDAERTRACVIYTGCSIHG